jgi:rhodanese-related sulfurtransferase
METIDPHQLRARANSIKLYDVRKRPDDRQIPGSIKAEGKTLETGDELPFAKDEEVVLYCGSGNSCTRIAAHLRGRGYRAAALEGGYEAWIEARLPTEGR